METTTGTDLGPSHTRTASPIIWALDAFSDDLDTHLKTAHAIFAHSPESPIHPVYVLSEELFSSRGYSSFLRPALKPRARHTIETTLAHDGFALCRHRFQDPRVLVESTADASRCTKKLLRYAKRVGSRLVAFGTHGRSRLSRWFAGSFAETLMQESSVPLLVVGPRQALSSQSPRGAVIVPTNFTEDEHEGFLELLSEAERSHLSVHFIHRLSCPLENWAAGGLHTLGGAWVPVETYFDDRCTKQVSHAHDWLREARARGVDARVVAENFRESVADSIIDYAKKLDRASPMIALLRAGPMGGSVRTLMRELVRHSPYPLYVSGLV